MKTYADQQTRALYKGRIVGFIFCLFVSAAALAGGLENCEDILVDFKLPQANVTFVDEAATNFFRTETEKMNTRQLKILRHVINELTYQDMPAGGLHVSLLGRRLITIQKKYARHPMGVINTIHETAHLIESIGTSRVKDAASFLKSLFDFKATLNAEAVAYGAEYDFVRTLIKHRDFPLYWNNLDSKDALTEVEWRDLEDAGVLNKWRRVELSYLARRAAGLSEATRVAAQKLILIEANERFEKEVHEVLNYSRANFIQNKVEGYRKQQLIANLGRIVFIDAAILLMIKELVHLWPK